MNTQMPIGVDDFKEVRENYYFVDKTHFIQSLIGILSYLSYFFFRKSHDIGIGIIKD